MPTIVPRPIFKCGYCDKFYNRKSSFEKHSLKCEIIHSKPSERELITQKCIELPNQLKLYDLIKELVHKQAKQEKEIESLKQYINKTKKRRNIIEWLNENCKKTLSFQSFLNSISINRTHLDYIFKYDFIDGIMFIFQDIFPLNEDLPIRCFDQKPGTFFIVNNEWVVMTGLEYENMIHHMTKLVIKEFGQWQKDNYERIFKDEKFNEIYQQNIMKVLGTKIPKEKLNIRIKNKLYSYLKFNLKRIIEFEFS